MQKTSQTELLTDTTGRLPSRTRQPNSGMKRSQPIATPGFTIWSFPAEISARLKKRNM